MIKSMRMAFSLFNSVASLPPPPLVNPNLTTSSFIGLNHNIIPTITKKHHKIIFFLSTSRSLFTSAATPSQGNTEGQETSQDETPAPPSFSRSSSSSARTQIDLLDQLTSSNYDNYQKLTIRQQLANLVGDRDDDFTIPFGKNLKKVSASFLTISQKRNIKRQTYLNEVSQRNDCLFRNYRCIYSTSTNCNIRDCYSNWLCTAISLICIN